MRFETLEFCARAIIYGKMVGKPTYLSDEEIDMFEAQVPPSLPQLEAVSYPPDEKEKRYEICQMVHRACRQGLMMRPSHKGGLFYWILAEDTFFSDPL